MHGYASDNFFRGSKVYFIFGVVAITAASGLRTFISMPQLSGYFDFAALSAGVIYSGLIFFYEQWGWRWLSTKTLTVHGQGLSPVVTTAQLLCPV